MKTQLSSEKRNNYIYLTLVMAFADFKIGYKGSFIGYLWPVISPLLRFCILFTVFSLFLRFDIPYYSLYLLLGIITWNFFSEYTSYSMQALLSKAPIVRNINFDRSIIIISAFITSSISFYISFILFFIFWLFSDIKFDISILWVIPFFLTLSIWCLGLSFFLSSVGSRFKDLRHIWDVSLQLFFWLTPIVYPMEMVPEKFRILFVLNPFHHIINGLRTALIKTSTPSMPAYIMTTLSGLVVLLIGFKLYKKLSKYFPEYI